MPEWKVSDGPTGSPFRLDKLEDALLGQIQELRGIKSEIQKHAANGSLEPLLGADQVTDSRRRRWARSRPGANRNPLIMVGKYRKFSPSQ